MTRSKYFQMKKFFLFAVLSAGASFGFMSCMNGDYDANPNTNNSNVKVPVPTGNGGNINLSFLTTGSWITTAAILITGNDTLDLYLTTPECETDNIYAFNSDKTITTDEGATKCFPNDPQTKSDEKWDLNGSKFQIIRSDNVVVDWDVVTLTNTSFIITHQGSLNGINYTSTQTFSRP